LEFLAALSAGFLSYRGGTEQVTFRAQQGATAILNRFRAEHYEKHTFAALQRKERATFPSLRLSSK